MKIQCESVADRRDRGGSDRELRINSRRKALAALVAKAIVIHIGVTGGGNSRPRFDHRAAGRAMAPSVKPAVVQVAATELSMTAVCAFSRFFHCMCCRISCI